MGTIPAIARETNMDCVRSLHQAICELTSEPVRDAGQCLRLMWLPMGPTLAASKSEPGRIRAIAP